MRRLTFHSAADGVPVWNPDGKRLVFGSYRDGPTNLYVKEVHAATPETRLLMSDVDKYPTDWSRDGRYLMYEASTLETGWDLWVLRTEPGSNSTTEA